MPGPNATWKRAKGRVPLLTSHQRQILDLLESGSSNQQQADHFLITLNQAKADINAILGRLELSSREELAGFWTWQRQQRAVPLWVKLLAGAGVAMFLVLGVGGVLMGGNRDGAHPAVERSLGLLVYLVGCLSAFFASLILGKLSNQKGKFKVFQYSVFASAVMVYFITCQIPVDAKAIVLVMMGLWFTVATGRAVTAQAMISNIPPPAQRGSFMSFNSSVQQLGTSAVSFLS